jgi:cardiolipin synthase
MAWINSVFFRRLDRSGLRIYFYRPSVLHAKTILGDDWAIVGSSNLNHRSWLHDLEVDTVITSEGPLRELAEQFERDLQNSLPSPPVQPPSWRVRITDQMAMGIRYFI